MSKRFTRFKKLQNQLFKRKIKKKSDVFKLKGKTKKDYFIFKKWLGIDGRYKPERVRKIFSKIKKDSIHFKSYDLDYKLYKMSEFDDYDYFTSSKKLIAIITSVLQKHKHKIKHIEKIIQDFDISYKNKITKQGVRVKLQKKDLDWIADLPDDFFINIDDTAYNKNGFEFVEDYYNTSNDYSKHGLAESVKNFELFIYRR